MVIVNNCSMLQCSILASQTIHSIQNVFIPGGLPGVSYFLAKRIFDIALIKLGEF